MKITKALIIDEPWLGKILAGEKDWEMRSNQATHRGLFGLIRKGSGKIYGVAELVRVSGPYDNTALAKNFSHHHVGSDLTSNPDYKWRFAWELKDIKTLDYPVSYKHKSGAVTWVALEDDVIETLECQLSGKTLPRNDRVFSSEILKEKEVKSIKRSSNVEAKNVACNVRDFDRYESSFLPVARDGSCFSKSTCNNKGIYTVGEKGDEQKFRSFQEALDYLKSMQTAKWRRPNTQGNWGIVSAVEWVKEAVR